MGRLASWTPNIKLFAFALLTIFFIYFGLAATLMVPGNPDYLLPLLPESLLLAALGMGYLIAFKWLGSPNTIWFTASDFKAFIVLLFVIFIYCLPRMLWSLGHTPHQVWNPCANIAPSAFVRLECYLQGAIIQFPGPRQFYMIITAFFVGIFSFFFARTFAMGQKFLANAVVLFSCIYCIAVFVGIYFGFDYLMPTYLGRAEYGGGRFALIHPNPSWIWPYLAPGLVCSLWGTTQNITFARKIIFLGASILLTISIYKTGQRGGLLLGVTLWTILAIWRVTRFNLRHKKAKITASILLLFVFSTAIYFGQDLWIKLMTGLGRTHFFDASRIAIWSAALPHVLAQKPLLGFGYASWFQEFRSIAHTAGAPLFDTAHNLFVQMLFEHGILGSFLLLSSLSLIAWTGLKNNKNENGKLFVYLGCSAFFCCATVQEIDYIRPTYYLHSLLWGILAGGSGIDASRINQNRPADSESNSFFTVKNLKAASTRKLKLTTILVISLASATSYFAAIYFTFGAFPFEGDLAKKEEKIGRWLGPIAQIKTFGHQTSWKSEVFAPLKNSLTLSKTTSNDCVIPLMANSSTFINLTTQSKWTPNRTTMTFSEKIPDGNRYITARLIYPPELAPTNTDSKAVADCKQN
jgi:hypothetical protein